MCSSGWSAIIIQNCAFKVLPTQQSLNQSDWYKVTEKMVEMFKFVSLGCFLILCHNSDDDFTT